MRNAPPRDPKFNLKKRAKFKSGRFGIDGDGRCFDGTRRYFWRINVFEIWSI
jgi:hypothetical protein